MMRRDIDDVDHRLFDADVAAERIRLRAEALAVAEERRVQEATQDAAAKARVAAGMIEANERARIAEYRAAGVFPPNGTRCTLALLLRLGWRIEEIAQGECVLVAPPTPAKWEGHRDADSLPLNSAARTE